MHFSKLVSLFLISLPITAFCSNMQPLRADIDNQLEQCKQSAVNTIATIDCYKVATKSWDEELNKQYKELIENQDDITKGQLINSQRAWVKYKTSYEKAIDSYYQQQKGSIWGLMDIESKMNITKDKAIDLYRLNQSTDLS